MMRLLIFIIIFLISNNVYAMITNQVVPVSYFVNHVLQLKKIEQNLNKYNKTSVVGTSGIGKTQLVRMYAYEKKSKYEIVWFFDGKLDIDTEFSRLAHEINNKEGREVISTEISNAKKETMRYLSSKSNWLLVFDNNVAKQNHKISEFINWDNNGHIIFASQDSGLLPHIISVDAFNKQDSVKLANNIIEEKSKDLVDFITNEFKGYPVLIVQSAQLLNNIPGLDKAVYKEKIINNNDRIKLNIELAIDALPESAKNLLYKIALINNQRFSKKLLTIISDHPNSLDADLYELSKFALISNIDTEEENPVFEMHDIIAMNILKLSSSTSNKKALESIIVKLTRAMPEGVHKGHIFRTSKTMHENLEVIFNNIAKYKPNILKLMEFNLILVTDYINTMNGKSAKDLIDWFQEQESIKSFKLNTMSEYEKYIYSRYLGAVGGYYRIILHDHRHAMKYFQRAQEILYKIENYYDIRSNTIYQLALSQIATGMIEEAIKNIQIIDNMMINKLTSDSESGLIHLAKAKLLNAQGDFNSALKEVNLDIYESLKHGLDKNDILFASTYMLKIEILNNLYKYQDALSEENSLHEMYKLHKEEDHEYFGRLYAQIAKTHLGLKDLQKAKHAAEKSLKILENHNNQTTKKEARFSEDVELAKAYLIYAEILLACNDLKDSIKSYEIAEGIYSNAYKENARKMHEAISTIYGGAIASQRANDDFWFKHFYNSLISLVGRNHHKVEELNKIRNSV